MVNVWPNSTFEASTDPWTANAGSDTPVLSSEHVYAGSRSLHCRRGSGTTTAFAIARAEAAFTAPGDYDISARLWIPEGITGNTGLRLTGTGFASTSNFLTAVRGDWVEVSGTVTYAGEGTARFDLSSPDPAAELWLDELIVENGVQPPEPIPGGSGIGCTVYIRPGGEGVLTPLADGSVDDEPLAPTVLSDLKVTWGRETTVDQPAAATCSFKLIDPAGGASFRPDLSLGVPVVVTATPPAGTDPASPIEEAAVFTGRVSSIKHTWDDSADAPVVTVDCVDFTADLEGTIVGDEPWLAESLQNRFARIAEQTTLSEWFIDQTLDAIPVTYRDVDAQGAMGLLDELASSVDGVLWSASSIEGTTRLILEDPSQRPAASGLVSGVYLSACDVLQDGVEWAQDVQDILTRISVNWFQQNPVGSEEMTTEYTARHWSDWREARYGRRSLSMSSQLTTKDNALEVAKRIFDRTGPNNWRIAGLTIDDALYDPGSLPSRGTRTNYVPDPSGEYDGITWTGTTPYRRDDEPRFSHTGATSYDFTAATANTAIAIEVPEWATSVTVSAWYRINSKYTTDATYRLRIAGTGAASVTTSPTYTGTTTYQFRSLTASVVPGGTISFYPAYGAQMGNTSQRFQVDDFGVAFDTEPADFNGDTPFTGTAVYAWAGTPGASPSVRVVRGSSEEYDSTILTLLNNNARNGLAIQLVEMPTWTVTPNTIVYLEGGSYTYTAGAWILALTVSKGPNIAPPATPSTWADLDPSMTWAQVDPALTWDQMPARTPLIGA